MKQTNVVVTLLSLLLLSSCGKRTSQTIIATDIATPAETSTAEAISTALPTSTPDFSHLDPSSILFEQDFEAGTTEGLDISSGEWAIQSEPLGNHSLCNKAEDGYSALNFGYSWWKDFAVEIKIKAIEQKTDPFVQLFGRWNSEKANGYYESLNFGNGDYDLAYSDPYQSLGRGRLQSGLGEWITLRLEVAGSGVKYYINNHLVAYRNNTQLLQGEAKIVVYPYLKACIDDIRAWALTETGSIGQIPIIPISLEVVTDNAEKTNNWGGHQSRIVRTRDGIFTTYITSGSDAFHLEWNLAERGNNGVWKVIARDNAGDGPAILLASDDGTLHIIGWPDGIGTMWSGKPNAGTLEMIKSVIPGVFQGFWAYPSAGIDKAGDICVTSSTGGQVPGGTFMWACYFQSQGKWISHTTQIDYKFAYTYVFPASGSQLSLVSNRDVRWSALGYVQPAGVFDYTGNAVGFWRTDDINIYPLERVFLMEEIPTSQFPYVVLNNCQQDAFIDTSGNMHIIYKIQGESTKGAYLTRQVVLSPDGKIITDVPLPSDIGAWVRIFQDSKGLFYILGSSGVLYPAGKDGITLGSPFIFDLKGYAVEYSGIYIAAPRGGTTIGDVLDVGFVTGNGNQWIYFQLKLPGQ